jgi:hypothetical protein
MILFAFALGVWSMIVTAHQPRLTEQQLDNHPQSYLPCPATPRFRDDPVIEHRFTPPQRARRLV